MERFTRIPFDVFEHLPKLSLRQIKVYLVIASMATNDNHECWPSLFTLSKRTGIPATHIPEVIRQIESLQLIQVTRKHRNTNKYRLLCKSLDIPI